MTEHAQEFEVDREKLARCLYWVETVVIALTGLFTFGVGAVIAVVYALTIGRWLPRRQADAERYWIEGTTLRLDKGVYFLRRKAIPLDRITDLKLTQNPILRCFGIWALAVQTAGTGAPRAEGVLWALRDPEAVRDALLKARDEAVAAAVTGPGA